MSNIFIWIIIVVAAFTKASVATLLSRPTTTPPTFVTISKGFTSVVPFVFGFLQYSLVFFFSFIIAIYYENPTISNIRIEWFEILYTGILSAGVGYTLQIMAQQKASPAPAAIILSMESVFATISGWVILNQTLDTNKILGCIAIFTGVVIVQLIPIMIKSK